MGNAALSLSLSDPQNFVSRAVSARGVKSSTLQRVWLPQQNPTLDALLLREEADAGSTRLALGSKR